ncbi:hypothetical protein COJ00_23625, partial [Priestia megaterium]
LVVYHGFLSTVKLFSLSTPSCRTPQPSLQDAEAVSAEPSIMHCFFKPRQLRRSFFSTFIFLQPTPSGRPLEALCSVV